MENFGQHSGVVLAVLCAIVGLFAAVIGAYRGEPMLFWGGLFLAAVGFVLGKPPDPGEEIDRRAEEHE
jgi:fucose permease